VLDSGFGCHLRVVVMSQLAFSSWARTSPDRSPIPVWISQIHYPTVNYLIHW